MSEQQPEDWLEYLERIRKGDPVALVRVTQLITAYLSRAGAYNLRDSWDDVCQEVLLKLLRSASDGSIRNPSAFVGFVGTVTRNTLVDWIRRNKPGATVAGEPEELEREPSGLGVDRTRDPDLLLDVERGLSDLPPEEAEVIHAVYFEGRKYADAAKHLGVPLGTLKRRQTQGLRRLRTRMGIDLGQGMGNDRGQSDGSGSVRADPNDPFRDADTSTSSGDSGDPVSEE